MSLRSSLTYLPGVLLPKISTLCLIVLGTRLLATEEYGYFTLVTLIGEIADSVAANWLRVRFLRTSAQQISRDLLRAEAARAAVACAVSIAGVVLYWAWNVGTLSALFCLATVLYVLGVGFSKFSLTLLQARQRGDIYSRMEAGRAACTLLAAAPVMMITGSFFWTCCVATAAMVAFGLWGITNCWRAANHEHMEVQSVEYAPSIIVVTALTYAVAGMDRLALTNMVGASAVGIYAAAYALARQGFDVFGNAANLSGFTRLMRAQQIGGSDEASRVVGNQLLVLLGVFIPALAILWAFADDFSATLLAPQYRDKAGQLMRIVAVGAIAVNLKSFLFDNILHAYSRSRLQIVPLVVGSAVTVGMCRLLIPPLHEKGAALAFAAGGLAALGGSIVCALTFLRPQFERHAVNMFLIVIAVTCAGAALLDRLLVGVAPLLRCAASCLLVLVFFAMAGARTWRQQKRNAMAYKTGAI